MIVNELKEDMLYVHDEPADARILANVKDETYELPDGQTISMGGERIKFCESLFGEVEGLPGFKGL